MGWWSDFTDDVLGFDPGGGGNGLVSSGKSGDGGSGMFDYYASFACVFSATTADVLKEVIVDGERVWNGSVFRASSSNPYRFNICLLYTSDAADD